MPAIQELMKQSVTELSTPDHVTQCNPKETLSNVIRILSDSKIGSIVITDADKVVGIFTERDFLTKIATRDIDLTKEPIEKHMTPSPICVTQEACIADALMKMQSGEFRHLIVTDASGKLQSIISIKDVMSFLLNSLIDDIVQASTG